MSYCRFSSDSDVYAYDCEGGVQIWVTKRGLDRLCRTYVEAYQYILRLRDVHGLSVPDYATEALKAEADEEISKLWGIAEYLKIGPDGEKEINSLADENARLRSCLSDDAENARQIMGENAKLRDVCTDAYKAICKMYSRIDGEWNYGDAGSDPVYGPILRRMSELGIGAK